MGQPLGAQIAREKADANTGPSFEIDQIIQPWSAYGRTFRQVNGDVGTSDVPD
jgi:hypothetical protein